MLLLGAMMSHLKTSAFESKPFSFQTTRLHDFIITAIKFDKKAYIWEEILLKYKIQNSKVFAFG
jgi:hypothetical protein